jgi:hypothetical protein
MLSHGDAATSGYMTRVHVQKGEGERGSQAIEEIQRYIKINTTLGAALSLLFFKRDVVFTEQLSTVLIRE